MELLSSIGNILEFGLAVAAALGLGIKLLPLAELLLTESLPEDFASET